MDIRKQNEVTRDWDYFSDHYVDKPQHTPISGSIFTNSPATIERFQVVRQFLLEYIEAEDGEKCPSVGTLEREQICDIMGILINRKPNGMLPDGVTPAEEGMYAKILSNIFHSGADKQWKHPAEEMIPK